MAQEVWAIDRISEQLGKLVSLASKVYPNSSVFPRGSDLGRKPEYSLMSHMTWDENGELRID